MSTKPEAQPLLERLMQALEEFTAQGVSQDQLGVYVGDVKTATVFLPEPSFKYLTDKVINTLNNAYERGESFGTLYGQIPLRFDRDLGAGILEVRGGEQFRATMTID